MRLPIRFVLVAFVLWIGAVAAPAQEPDKPANVSKEERLRILAWHKAMARTVPKKGCFQVTHPRTDWAEVQCTKPPNRPYAPGPQIVGNGTDWSAEVTSGTISSSVGSFDSMNVTSENDNGNADTYSLQLNSSPFSSPAACSGASNPATCQGWQQFVYSTTSHGAFIQYWLLNYGTTCPSGWFSSGPNCYQNSVHAVGVPSQPLSNLPSLSLAGTVVSGGTDTLTMTTPDGTLHALNHDSVLGLASGWTASEFGVFGDGGGSAATFNSPGATMAIRTSVDNGTTTAPNCLMEGFTGETNNLNLIPPCCAYGGTAPAIVYWLSDNPGATSECVDGTSIGDTHLKNFNGLFYDFQASGDFVLAQTNHGFVVHTRQKSGAPRWPDASVNKAVAMTLGKTRAAVCLDPTRVVIDGKPRELANDKTLTLASGVRVTRSGNVYSFTRPSTESVRAEVNPGWIDVTVSLGQLPEAKVYGLLGNRNGDMEEDDLARRDRVVLQRPLVFDDFYQAYAGSWRVSSSDSLVADLCGAGDAEPGIPDKPFYAQHLEPKDYERARTICTKAGVRDTTLLDACTLDTAVLGEAASRVFARMRPPRNEVRVNERRR